MHLVVVKATTNGTVILKINLRIGECPIIEVD